MNKRLLFVQYLGFITIGLVNTIISPLIPAMNTEFKMNFGQMGYILSGQFFGCLITVIFGGYLADRFGKKPFLLIGGVILICGLTGSIFSGSYNQLLFWNIITGLGFGTYEIGINALCADVTENNKGGAMNFLHFFFGLGAISGPLLATFCTRVFESWRLTFGITLILPLLVSFILVPLKVNKAPHTESKEEKIPFHDLFIWIVGLSTFIYVGIETSVFGWMPVYWEKLPSSSFIPATMIGMIFWLSLTVGRLICGAITDRLGFPKFLLLAAAGTAVFSLVWWMAPNSIVTFGASLIIGLFLASVFPTIMASMTSYYPANSGKIAAFVTVFAALGGFLVPTAIGKLADRIGIMMLPAIIFVMAVLMVLGIYTAWFRMKKNVD
ncbi:MAG: MFS transporter [Clostridia bacterium]|nr:MFS transporter [Clostridia bacterium]